MCLRTKYLRRVRMRTPFIFCLLSLGLSSCYKDDISYLQSQIDQINASEIATIDSQIKAINTSITDLKKVDETINGLVGELQKDGEMYATQIADLQAINIKLDEKITTLQGYTDEELAKQKDWVEATFATLDQLDSLCAVVTAVDAKIDSVSASLDSLKKELVAGYEESIEKAVSNLETSMKKWVNDQLADYYTIAQTDAALKALEEKYDKADEDLEKEIDEQKTALENSKKDITEAYKKAIEEAITAHDGKINDEIAKDIVSAKKELQDQIDVINTEITNIKTRLTALEKELEELARRPQSIVVLAVKPIVLSTGAQASIEFRVNPSTAVFDYSEENCQIVLDKAGTVSTKASYVTKPQNYKLVKIEQVVNQETQEEMTGQYRALIEDTGRSAEYDEMVALVLNVKDAKGNDIQISSSVFEIIGKNFENLPKTGLPVIVVNTVNASPIVSKEIWQEGATVTILNPDMTYDYQGTSEIKGRGNSTWWWYSKKPYTLKLNKKSKILGMPKDKRWNLLTNAPDRTNLRNSVGFYLAKQTTALGWTPNSRHVELVLNGQNMGLYLLCEHIKVSDDRVNIEEMKSSDIDGQSITGGYLMELDNSYDEINKFKTDILDLPVMFKEPDEDVLAEEQFNYMKDYFNRIETYITNNPIDMGYKDLIDIESFAEYFLVKEIVSNYELSIPRSIYMNKDRNGKLKIGPVWDFDLDPFYIEPNSFRHTTSIWYKYLFKDPEFVAMVKRKWTELKPKFMTVFNYIDDVRDEIKESAEVNNDMWPITEENKYYCDDYLMPYENAVDRLTEGVRRKIKWIDAHIDEL